MDSADPVVVLRFITIAFLGGLGGLVFFRMLTGTISTVGLFTWKGPFATARRGERLDPARIGLLVLTLLTALWYLGEVSRHKPKRLPDVPGEMLALLGGGHAAYLGRKLVMYMRSSREREDSSE